MSPPDRPKHRSIAIAVAAALGVLAPGAVAQAVPATASNFQIFYYTTDEDGNRGRQMTQTDLDQFVNRARCECGQSIEAKITLLPMGMTIDQQPIRTFAGTMCGQGQTNAGATTQVRPCVLLEDQLPNYYTKSPSIFFEPIWLKTGVSPSGGQSIGQATPDASCDSGQGEGGIWICVENGTQTDCQSDEFIIQGTQNNNVATGQMAQAIRFDFLAPMTLPTGFAVSSGDGALQVSWSFDVTTDIAGYRILCADADGNPVPGKGLDAPGINEQNRGQLYFTKENLCPDGPFGQGGGEDPATDDGTGTGGDGGTGGDDVTTFTGGSDGGSDGGFGTSGGALWGETPFGGTVSGGGSGGLDTGGTDASSGGSGSTGTSDSGGSDDRGTGGSAGGSGTGGDFPSTGIESLDWAYVCSGHLSFNTDNGRIDGLQNGQEYQILVVAYDAAGNPAIASEVLRGTPVETRDLWEQCEEQGNVCGEGGFCQCSADRPAGPGALLLSLFFLPALRRRRAA